MSAPRTLQFGPQLFHRQIATVLRHERKINSYKIALVRAFGDLALAFPDLGGNDVKPKNVAIPLSSIAEFWVAYYWPFCDPEAPILQGGRRTDPRTGKHRQDIVFREELEVLRTVWLEEVGVSASADGYYLIEEMRSLRRRKEYSDRLVQAFVSVCKKAGRAVRQPVRYAGREHWELFSRPQRLRDLRGEYGGHLDVVPGTSLKEFCVVVEPELWRTFRELSLWVEALAVHAWCLYTEEVNQSSVGRTSARRGEVYESLTHRPDNRRPLTWERNRVDLLMMEGSVFECPWTGRKIAAGIDYDIDHLVPIALYPTNELWNLAPTDRAFNQHKKRDRLPSDERLRKAQPRLAGTFRHYLHSQDLGPTLLADARGRFADVGPEPEAEGIARAAVRFVATAAEIRNAPRFD